MADKGNASKMKLVPASKAVDKLVALGHTKKGAAELAERDPDRLVAVPARMPRRKR